MAGAVCVLYFLQSPQLKPSPKSFCSAREQPLVARLRAVCEYYGDETEQRSLCVLQIAPEFRQNPDRTSGEFCFRWPLCGRYRCPTIRCSPSSRRCFISWPCARSHSTIRVATPISARNRICFSDQAGRISSWASQAAYSRACCTSAFSKSG